MRDLQIGKKSLVVSTTAAAIVMSIVSSVNAVEVVDCTADGLQGTIACPGTSEDPVVGTILRIVGLFMWFIVAAAVIMIIYGGIRMAVSSGNQQDVASARKTIQYALIGMVLAMLSGIILTVISAQLFPST